jgi:hypothetical protein
MWRWAFRCGRLMPRHRVRVLARQPWVDVWSLAGRPDGSNLRNIANPGLGPAWSPDGRWVYYATRGSAAAPAVVLKKIPVDEGPAVTVTSERLRNVIGLDGTTLYYLFERPAR